MPLPSVLAVHAHPDDARSEDAWITTTVDVGPWLPQKPTAIFAHRSEV